MKLSYKLALGGIIMALSCVLMTLTNIFSMASFALPAIAGAIIIIINLEIDKKWAFLVYAGVSIISIFISSDHTAIVSFIVLLGFYPIIKQSIECIKNRVLEWVCKIAIFNVSIAVGVVITIIFLGIDLLIAEYSGFSRITLILFIIFCNGAFVLYDIALTKFVTFTVLRILPILRKIK